MEHEFPVANESRQKNRHLIGEGAHLLGRAFTQVDAHATPPEAAALTA